MLQWSTDVFLCVTQWQTPRPCKRGGSGTCSERVRGGVYPADQQMVCYNTRGMLSYLLDMASRNVIYSNAKVTAAVSPGGRRGGFLQIDSPCPAALRSLAG